MAQNDPNLAQQAGQFGGGQLGQDMQTAQNMVGQQGGSQDQNQDQNQGGGYGQDQNQGQGGGYGQDQNQGQGGDDQGQNQNQNW
jgi:hypothetical protein